MGKWTKSAVSAHLITPKLLKVEEDMLKIHSTSEVWTRFELLEK